MPRDPKDSQIDRYVDPRFLAYLGGAKTLLGRSGWYTGKARMLIIWVMGYYTIPQVSATIPSVYAWLAILFVAGAVLITFEYYVMWPSEIIFGNVHDEDANRSPIRRDTQAIREQLADLIDENASYTSTVETPSDDD